MNYNCYKIISEYRTLKENSFYPFEATEEDSEKIELRKKEIKEKFKELKYKIESFPNETEIVEKYKFNIISAIRILLDIVKKSRSGSPLDRNQGLNIENFIFGKVIGVIKDSLKDGYQVSYPDFYHNPVGDFEEAQLRNLLIELENELHSEFKSYFELEDCVDKYLNKINLLWKEENEKLLKNENIT